MPSRVLGQGTALGAALAVVFALATTRPAAAFEAWLSAMGKSGQDYVGMFDHAADWAATARKIQVFQVHAGVLRRLPDNRLALLLKDLKERHLAFALFTPILDPVPACPLDESFFLSAPNEQALRIQRLGGEVNYISFDEPIYYGSQKRAGTPCSMSVPALARAAAPAIMQLHKMFPSAKFGDIEPTEVPAESIIGFADELKKVSGVSLSFVHADIVWKTDWRVVLPVWRRTIEGQGMRYGVILDGGGAQGQDSAWSQEALARFHSIPAAGLGPNDDLLFMSWNRAPAAYYPETMPGTMTNMAGQALGAFGP